MSDQYLYRTLGMEFGPVSLASIQKMLNEGILGTGDKFCEVGGTWRDLALLSKDGSSDRTRALGVPSEGHSPKPLVHSTPSANSTGPPTKNVNWFFKKNDRVAGPIDTEQFLLAVGNGTVVRQTLVRLNTSQQWVAAVEIAGLEFPANLPTILDDNSEKSESSPSPHSNMEMRRLFAECLESKNSKGRSPEHVRPQSALRCLNVRFGSGIGFVVSYASETFSSIGKSAFSFLASGLVLRLVLAVMIVVLAVFAIAPLIPKVSDTLVTQRHTHASLAEIFAEVKELRSQDVDASRWKELHDQSEKKISEFLPSLKRHASASDPASMSLLWVARDYLPTLLASPKSDSTKTDEKIAIHLQIAEASFQKAAPQGEFWDVLSTWMIGVDVFSVCAAFAFFGRSWFSR